jgi:hypothetical protein
MRSGSAQSEPVDERTCITPRCLARKTSSGADEIADYQPSAVNLRLKSLVVSISANKQRSICHQCE